MKVVVNKCHGGFSLSHEAMMRYGELAGINLYPEIGRCGFYTYWKVPKEQQNDKFYSELTLYERDLERDDPWLVQVVEELGDKANGHCADLKVVEIPDDVGWHIAEYDGREWVAENHRTW